MGGEAEGVADEEIDRVFAVMALCPQHTFQILTKRAARMRAYLSDPSFGLRIGGELMRAARGHVGAECHVIGLTHQLTVQGKPLPNVWLGVSAEDQRRADERVPDLLATPAAVRFVSAEPLLGPIDFTSFDDGQSEFNALTPHSWESEIEQWRDTDPEWEEQFLDWFSLGAMPTGPMHPRLDWIIAGGESGPGARPMHPDWARRIRDACAAAGVAFHFKQHGAWTVAVDRERDDPVWRADYSNRLNDRVPGIAWLNGDGGCGFHGERFHVMRRVGKAAAGRELDGVTHDAMPEVRCG